MISDALRWASARKTGVRFGVTAVVVAFLAFHFVSLVILSPVFFRN
jgi:hypothetical protein